MEDGVFHERFRLAIKESGMTVREIAKQSGVKKRTIDRWIGQNPPVPNVLEFSYVSKAITKRRPFNSDP
jgi:transcriptional regulator with XRE-family HTH domain